MSELEPKVTERRGTPSDAIIAEILREPVVDGLVAGKALRLGRSATYRALKSGEIPAFKVGGQYRCPTPPLREMLKLTAPIAT